jgi:hypothetical protein
VIAALLLSTGDGGCNAPRLGQSGSEELPTPPNAGAGGAVPCPCHYGTRTALRVTLLDQSGAIARLRVEEVLHGADVEPGDILVAQRWDDTLACFRGCATFEVGDQAFAFFEPDHIALRSRPCSALDACLDACTSAPSRDDGRAAPAFDCACRASPVRDSQALSTICGERAIVDPECALRCERETRDACPAPSDETVRLGHVGLSPWTDPIVFARAGDRELSVPLDELWRLWPGRSPDGDAYDQSACVERYGDWSWLLQQASGR